MVRINEESHENAAGNVTVAAVEYPLYTHVHHGYGLNDAFDRSVTLLTKHLPRGRGLLEEVSINWPRGVMTSCEQGARSQ